MTENPHQLTAEQAEQLRAYLLELLAVENPTPNHNICAGEFMEQYRILTEKKFDLPEFHASGASGIFNELWNDYKAKNK